VAGARHHDLNLKNVLIASRTPAPIGYVLDVDRVEFGRAGDLAIADANLARFTRSARKWRSLYGARLEDSALAELAASVRSAAAARPAEGLLSTTRS
jgi:hypothetical protein